MRSNSSDQVLVSASNAVIRYSRNGPGVSFAYPKEALETGLCGTSCATRDGMSSEKEKLTDQPALVVRAG